MRRLFLSFLLILTLTRAFSQQRISIVSGVHKTSISPFWELQPGATSQVMQNKSNFHIGLIADMPVARFSNLYFQPGILYTTKGAKQQQAFDTSLTKTTLYTYSQSINYVDLPLNLVYKFPSASNTRFVLGGGVMNTMFYSGSTSYSSLDTAGNFILEINRDLPVGKSKEQFKTLNWSFNVLAGLEFGKAFITANFSKGFSSYYQQGNGQYKHATVGITLGIFFNAPKDQEHSVIDGIYECPEWW